MHGDGETSASADDDRRASRPDPRQIPIFIREVAFPHAVGPGASARHRDLRAARRSSAAASRRDGTGRPRIPRACHLSKHRADRGVNRGYWNFRNGVGAQRHRTTAHSPGMPLVQTPNRPWREPWISDYPQRCRGTTAPADRAFPGHAICPNTEPIVGWTVDIGLSAERDDPSTRHRRKRRNLSRFHGRNHLSTRRAKQGRTIRSQFRYTLPWVGEVEGRHNPQI